ncbi:MAG TPA: hypothetical protein VNL17_07205 [Verrucomicrobiae bacterium]|nr:hypothetical protein [Verrucomicrobiae bacterium]
MRTTMHPHAPETSAVAIHAQARIDELGNHILFRALVFTLSVAGGYYLSRFMYTVLCLLPSWIDWARTEASPLADIARFLHSAFGN